MLQAAKPSPQNRLRDRAIGTRRGLDDLDGCILAFPDNHGAGGMFIQRGRGDFRLTLGLLGSRYAGLGLFCGIVSSLDVKPASGRQKGCGGYSGKDQAGRQGDGEHFFPCFGRTSC